MDNLDIKTVQGFGCGRGFFDQFNLSNEALRTKYANFVVCAAI